MKQVLIISLFSVGMATATPVPVDAATGVINRACRASDRPAANPQLCGCVQRVANQTLNRSERKTVAKWFDDPHRAQEVKMSDRSSDERLWKRYKAFGDLARRVCS